MHKFLLKTCLSPMNIHIYEYDVNIFLKLKIVLN